MTIDYSHVRRTAPRHIIRRKVKEYVAVYKAGKKGKGKQRIVVRTLFRRPPPIKEFQLSGSTLRTFKRVQLKSRTKELILIVPTKTDKKSDKAKKKSRSKTAEEETDEELEDIADVEDLDEVELTDDDDTDEETDDTDDDDAEEDEDEDEDEEVEKPKGKKKSKAKGSRASNNGKIGTQEIAEKAEVDARTLRMVLRKHSVEKDEESGRYEWDSLDDPTVKKILKWIKAGEAKDIKKESLDKLKEKKAAEKEGKKGKKKNKKKKEEEDEDDE